MKTISNVYLVVTNAEVYKFVPSPRERVRERVQYKAVQLEILRSAQYDESVKSLSNPVIASVCEAIQLNPQCRRGNADLHNSEK